MAYAYIGQQETPEQLSARLGRPICMLLRANRLCSTAWLLPGRQIIVPADDFCRRDAGACPMQLLHIPSEHFMPCDASVRQRLPYRLQRWSDTHGRVQLPQWAAAGGVYALRPCESMAEFAARTGSTEAEVRRINRYFGKPVSGVRLLAVLPEGDSADGETGITI